MYRSKRKKVFSPQADKTVKVTSYVWIPCRVCAMYHVEDVTLCGQWKETNDDPSRSSRSHH